MGYYPTFRQKQTLFLGSGVSISISDFRFQIAEFRNHFFFFLAVLREATKMAVSSSAPSLTKPNW